MRVQGKRARQAPSLGAICLAAAAGLFIVRAVPRPGPPLPARTGPSPAPRLRQALPAPSLRFERNEGQTGPDAQFVSRGSGYTLSLKRGEAILHLRHPRREARPTVLSPPDSGAPSATLKMKLIGANPNPRAAAGEKLASYSNYFIGSDPRRWRTRVPHYARVRYSGVYPGIDLVYYGNEGDLEHDFVVGPGADPRKIRLRFDGARSVSLDREGNLRLATGAGQVEQKKPVIYQERGGKREPVGGGYALRDGGGVGFEVAAYDRTRPLVIDPTLVYSTFLGGKGQENARAVASDAAGNAYAVGETAATDFPTVNPGQTASAGSYDVFVSKMNADGTALLYSTYLGGNGYDEGYGIVVGASGSIYITGVTGSTNFPTFHPFQAATKGQGDFFLAKFDPSGTSLTFSTYLGGTGREYRSEIALTSTGDVYLAGITDSGDLPTVQPLQLSANTGFQDIYLARFKADGSGLKFATYYGGTSNEQVYGLAVDRHDNVILDGWAVSNFPTKNPLQAAGGSQDAFVLKINADDTAVMFATLLGGSQVDEAYGIAVDSSDFIYVAGDTYSPNFPTSNSFQDAFIGGTCGVSPNTYTCSDGFLTKIKPDGSAKVYSAILGGGKQDYAWAVAVDGAGSAYVLGSTGSDNFPKKNSLQPALAGDSDLFLTKVRPAGNGITYSTLLGGSDAESPGGVSVDADGTAYLMGASFSHFPTTFGVFQPAHAADNTLDAVLVKIADPASAPPLGCGDANADHQVDVGDAVAVLKYIVGQVSLDSRETRAADTNHDTVINVIDAVEVLRIATQIDPPCT